MSSKPFEEFQSKRICHPERAPQRESNGPAVSSVLNIRQPISEIEPHPLAQLRRFTPARISLNRTGNSLTTSDLLDFSLAHALARDAVHNQLDSESIIQQLKAADLEFIQVHSAAKDRATYLRRPDLGRKLEESSRTLLAEAKPAIQPDIVFVIADGLSAIAPERYAVPIIQQIRQLLPDWSSGPVVIAEQARVALGDEAGELLQAEITVMLIGERPGLSSPDSLGIYLTYDPKPGRTDAERNCISNVRAEGVSIERAAETLSYLITSARRLQLSGVGLKDDSDRVQPSLPGSREVPVEKQIKSG
jgi:ethanolamine ammonia-lyase small subunit